jgi:hypothetical protein
MCVLCGQMFGEIHWSERHLDPVQVSYGSGETSRRQERHARIRLLRKVLAQSGLEIRDDGSATSYVVGNRKGDQRLVASMGELWRVAEQMAGKPLDPSDEPLLERLRNIECNA